MEITCRLECISAAAKWSPNATHKTVGRPRYSQLQVRLANREFLLPKSLSEFLVIIFLLSHLQLITLRMHSPTNTRHNITSKDKFGTGTLHLADMPTAVHRQNSWKITGWSHGTVSMAMHCLGYNKLTPDGYL